MSASRPPSFPSDRLLLILSIIGIISLAFLLGVIAGYYKWPPAILVQQGLESADAWQERFTETAAEVHVDEELPKQFDEIASVRTTGDMSRATSGYTLITLRNGRTVFLIDMQGRIVHHWDLTWSRIWPNPSHVVHPVRDALIHVERAQLLPNGDLIASYESRGDTPYGYGMVKVDKDSNVIWTYNKNTHHDFYIERGTGNIYTLMQQMIDKPIAGLEDLEYPALTDYIAKLTPEGKELYRISVLQAFLNSPYADMLHYKVELKSWDHLHTNAIMEIEPSEAKNFPMFKAGDLLISIRNMAAIAVIDPELQKVVWAKQGIWRGQHAARVLENGNILIFDNLGARRTSGSRIIEYDPNTEKVVWSFEGANDHPFLSGIHGSLQRFSNGNTLIAETMNSRAIEVTPGGEIVWSYDLPKLTDDKGLYGITTAYRYTADTLTFLK